MFSYLQEEDVAVAIKKLIEYYQQQTESFVRIKILSLLSDIGSEQGADVQVFSIELSIIWKFKGFIAIICMELKTWRLLLKIKIMFSFP